MFAIANRQRHQAVVAEPDIREPAFAIDAHDEPEMIERRSPSVGLVPYVARDVVDVEPHRAKQCAEAAVDLEAPTPALPFDDLRIGPLDIGASRTKAASGSATSVRTPRWWNTCRFSNGTVTRWASCNPASSSSVAGPVCVGIPIRWRYRSAENTPLRLRRSASAGTRRGSDGRAWTSWGC